MKKILKISFILMLIFIFKTNVNASTVTWTDITEYWKLIEDENITITSNETTLTIEEKMDEETYKIEFKYEEGIISLVKVDKSSITPEQKYTLDMLEYDYIENYMIPIVCDLYNINWDSEIFNKDTYANYGIVFKTTNSDEEQDLTPVAIIREEVIEFTLNLDEFEEKTKSLQGVDNPEDDFTFDDTTISLSLVKANPTSLDLMVTIENYMKEGTCEIIMIPSEGTGFPTGTSKTVATINNCKVGQNKVTVPNLQSNTDYLFQVLLDGGIVGEEYKKFKTAATPQSTIENLTNPKTGDNNIAIVLIFLLSSMFSFSLIYNKKLKNY